jgi:MSHA biogenesis protein MshO
MPRNRPSRARGFTLLEMVVSIVILGILSAAVAVYLQKPIEGYFDTTRRAQLVETADFALRRIARDLAMSLPNSVRSSATEPALELLLTRSGGRYCNAADCGTPLPGATASFSVIGPAVNVANGDAVVIGNLPASGCDAYDTATANRRALNFAASNSTTIAFSGGTAFNSSCAETTRRFQIVVGAVTFGCFSGTLKRYTNYAVTVVQPSLATLEGTATQAALATNVDCATTSTIFDTTAIGDGLVELRIRLKDASGESVNLYRQVKVDNAP